MCHADSFLLKSKSFVAAAIRGSGIIGAGGRIRRLPTHTVANQPIAKLEQIIGFKSPSGVDC